MKEGIKNFIKSIGTLLSYLFPYKVYRGLKKIKSFIFSGYVSGQFKKTGQNFNITSPLNLSGGHCITIGDNFTCMSGLWIDAIENYGIFNYQPRITIGNNVNINVNCHIGCINSINIGNNVLIASKVYITDHFHGDTNKSSEAPVLRKLESKGGVNIGDNVWVGEAVVIMPGVCIGANSIIGANSVVTKSFPHNSVIAGVPARLINVINNG